MPKLYMIDYTEKREGDGWVRVEFGQVAHNFREISQKYNIDPAQPFEEGWTDSTELFLLASDAEYYGIEID